MQNLFHTVLQMNSFCHNSEVLTGSSWYCDYPPTSADQIFYQSSFFIVINCYIKNCKSEVILSGVTRSEFIVEVGVLCVK